MTQGRIQQELARRVLIVRHAETDWNAEGRWQGRRDVPLSDRGREQAQALARRFEGLSFGLVVASALSRARETAEIVSGEVPSLDPALVEISYGAWEGVRDVEVHERWPELRRLWGSAPDRLTLPEGESLADVEARAWPAFTGWIDATDGDVLCVLHGGVNRILLARVMGLPLSSFWRVSQDPTAVNVVELPQGPAAGGMPRARVRLINCTAHLR